MVIARRHKVVSKHKSRAGHAANRKTGSRSAILPVPVKFTKQDSRTTVRLYHPTAKRALAAGELARSTAMPRQRRLTRGHLLSGRSMQNCAPRRINCFVCQTASPHVITWLATRLYSGWQRNSQSSYFIVSAPLLTQTRRHRCGDFST